MDSSSALVPINLSSVVTSWETECFRDKYAWDTEARKDTPVCQERVEVVQPHSRQPRRIDGLECVQ